MSAAIPSTDLIINPDGSVYHLNLRPKDIADTIIVVGDPGRVHRVSKHFDSIDFEMNKREFITHTGKYKGKAITVMSSGMGTDNVEIVMTELDALANIDLKKREPLPIRKKLNIIRIGTSGSIQNDVRVGTHLASQYAIGLDPLMCFYQYESSEHSKIVCKELKKTLELPFEPYCFKASESLLERFADCTTAGNTVTCPGFYAPQGRSLRIPIKNKNLVEQLQYFHVEDMWLTNLEMETAGYYALGALLGHEMLSLNAILANRIKNSFSKDANKVIDALIKKVLDRI